MIRERDPRVDRRGEIVARLIDTYARWIVWQDRPSSKRPAFALDDYFNAMADAGDFNRQNPDLAIPPRSDTQDR